MFAGKSLSNHAVLGLEMADGPVRQPSAASARASHAGLTGRLASACVLLRVRPPHRTRRTAPCRFIPPPAHAGCRSCDRLGLPLLQDCRRLVERSLEHSLQLLVLPIRRRMSRTVRPRPVLSVRNSLFDRLNCLAGCSAGGSRAQWISFASMANMTFFGCTVVPTTTLTRAVSAAAHLGFDRNRHAFARAPPIAPRPCGPPARH